MRKIHLSLIMKFIIFSTLLLFSCKTNTSKAPELSNMNELLNQQNAFTKILNGDNSLVLYYKVEKNKSNPVKIFTYYVVDGHSKNIVKSADQVAAEKIYWRDNKTLAIIPYTEVIQKDINVGDTDKSNEILIKIK